MWHPSLDIDTPPSPGTRGLESATRIVCIARTETKELNILWAEWRRLQLWLAEVTQILSEEIDMKKMNECSVKTTFIQRLYVIPDYDEWMDLWVKYRVNQRSKYNEWVLRYWILLVCKRSMWAQWTVILILRIFWLRRRRAALWVEENPAAMLSPPTVARPYLNFWEEVS